VSVAQDFDVDQRTIVAEPFTFVAIRR